MTRLAVIGLRVAIAFLFIGALSAQLWLIPLLAHDSAREWPELAHLAAPYTALWVAVVVCVQAVFVAMWVLLSKVRSGAIFSERAFAWVNSIIVAGVVATALVLGFELYHLGVENLGPPFLGILLSGVVVAGTAFVLIMIVMRGLLRSATTLQRELEEVV